MYEYVFQNYSEIELCYQKEVLPGVAISLADEFESRLRVYPQTNLHAQYSSDIDH
jgi:hypothetical protein